MFFKRISQSLHSSSRSYLDVASGTPLDGTMRIPRIEQGVLGANPHALHAEGVAARQVLESAREQVAAVLHAHRDEVIFTSGATESDNLALIGTIEAARTAVALEDIAIITSDLEHAAVLETVLEYKERGLVCTIVPTHDGVVDPKTILMPHGCKVLLVSIMYVNNEIGTVQPIRAIAKRLRLLRKQHPGVTIIFHCDATQAPVHYSLNVATLGIDLMTLGATKLYTTKGVGILYKRRGLSIARVMHGGGQEYGLRPGTEPVGLIHQFAYALRYADTIRAAESVRIRKLQTYFEQRVHESIPQAIVTAETKERSPHISHIAFRGFDSELLVIELDARGIAVSAKSACKNDLPALLRREQAGDSDESVVVEKLYGKGYGAVRFSFGRMTTKGDVAKAVAALTFVLKKYGKGQKTGTGKSLPSMVE